MRFRLKAFGLHLTGRDRKSTRLNSSHGYISYAVFCLKKKKQQRAPSMSAQARDCPVARDSLSKGLAWPTAWTVAAESALTRGVRTVCFGPESCCGTFAEPLVLGWSLG